MLCVCSIVKVQSSRSGWFGSIWGPTTPPPVTTPKLPAAVHTHTHTHPCMWWYVIFIAFSQLLTHRCSPPPTHTHRAVLYHNCLSVSWKQSLHLLPSPAHFILTLSLSSVSPHLVILLQIETVPHVLLLLIILH